MPLNFPLKFFSKINSSAKITSAALSIIGAIALSISMSVAKHLDPNVSTTVVVFMRNLFGILFFLPFIYTNRQKVKKSSNLLLQTARITLGVLAMFFTYYSYRNLPLSLATAIGMTNPIFVALFSVFFIKERIDYKQWICIFVGYAGAIVVIHPTNLVSNPAILSSILANTLAAFCMIIIKVLSKKDSTVTIMLYGNIGVTTLSLIPSVLCWYPLKQTISMFF